MPATSKGKNEHRNCSICGQVIRTDETVTYHNFVFPIGTDEIQHYVCARSRIEQDIMREHREFQQRRNGLAVGQ